MRLSLSIDVGTTSRRRHHYLRLARALLALAALILGAAGGAYELEQHPGLLTPPAVPTAGLPPPHGWPIGRPYVPIRGGAGATYYLDPAGNDANPCTSTGSPCLTLAHAATLAAAGDAIQFAAGTYGPQTGTLVGASGNRITVQPAPTGLVTITLPASPSDAAQQAPLVTLSGSSYVLWAGGGRIVLVGMKGRGDANLADHVAGGLFSLSTPGTSITVAATKILHANGTCLNVSAAPVVTIDANYLSDCGRAGVLTDYGLNLPALGAVASNNYVTSTTGAVLNASGGAGAADIITHNVIASSIGGPGLLCACTAATIANNTVVYNDPGAAAGAGIELNGGSNVVSGNDIEGNYGGVGIDAGAANKINNNTFFFESNYEVKLGIVGATNATIAENNIVQAEGYNQPFRTVGANATNSAFDYNALYGSSSGNMPASGADGNGNILLGTHSTKSPGVNFANVVHINTVGGVVQWPLTSLHMIQAGALGDATQAGISYSGAAPELGAYCYVSCPTVWGSAYSISPSGTDDGPCTIYWPCATLLRASDWLGPGDTLTAQSGTYYTDQTVYGVGTSSLWITVAAQQPVTLTRPYNNGNPSDPGNPAGATPYARDTPSLTTALLDFVSAGYITTTGFTLTGVKGRVDLPLPATVTGATNAAPIVITAIAHGFSSGDLIFVHGVGGDTAANGIWSITKTDADHFSLNSSNGTSSGTYTSGGLAEPDYPTNAEMWTHLSGSLGHVSLVSNTVLNADSGCIKDQNGNAFITVQGNTLTNCGLVSIDHGIYIHGTDFIASSNVISGVTGADIQIHGGSADRFLVQNNTMTGSYYAAVLQDSGSGTIDSNYIYGQESGAAGPNGSAISVLGAVTVTKNVIDNAPGQLSEPTVNYVGCIALTDTIRDLVAHNTCWNSGQVAIRLDFNGYASPIGENTLPITITDNIFANPSVLGNTYNNQSGGTASDSTVVPALAPSLVHSDYNTYFNYSTGTLNDAVAAGAHDLTGNPLFVSAPTTPLSDLHLQAGSPAIGAGVLLPSLFWPTNPPDQGAYPYGALLPTPTNTPLPTSTPTPTYTPTPTATPTYTPTPTPTSTPTITPTPLNTPLPSGPVSGSGAGSGVHAGHRR